MSRRAFYNLTNTILLVLLSIIVIKSSSVNASSSDEKQCEVSGGRKGKCVSIEDCLEALSNLRSGLFQKIVKCPESNRRVICCPTTPRISAQKCGEYTEALREEVTPAVAPLLPPGIFEDEDDSEQQKLTNCPLKSKNALISGGRPALVGEFPHVVAIGYNVTRVPWRCGGTLISDRYVLTAAHCISKSAGDPKKVMLGDVSLTSGPFSASRVLIDVEEVIVHPDYKPPKTYNDIALLKLREKVKFSRYIHPACLSQPEDDLLKEIQKEDVSMNVAGWGITGNGEAQSDVLQVAAVKGFKLKNCNDFYNDSPSKGFNFPKGITRSQICAGDVVGNQDTCRGDSGGPMWLTKYDKCAYYLLGITSFGPNLCGERAPGIYTNLLSYLDWVENHVWPTSVNDDLSKLT